MLGPQAGGAAMAMQASISHVMHHPLGVFSMLVAISAAVPPLIRRVGLPDLVGLLAAGVVVDQGRIAEQGCHDSLVAQGGIYTNLWQV